MFQIFMKEQVIEKCISVEKKMKTLISGYLTDMKILKKSAGISVY